MHRRLIIAAAQVGSVHKHSDREDTLDRLIVLLEKATSNGAKVVLFPEIALTTFFPRYLFDNQEELNKYFEHGDDIVESPHLKRLFEKARGLSVDISIGFAERTSDGKGYNTCVYYSAMLNKILSKYRKVHLPGTKEPSANKDAVNQLEKRYFEPGNLGFQAFRAPNLVMDAIKAGSSTTKEDTVGKGDPIFGMMICNDRRWPEAWRCYGLQGVELILCGYNTNGWAPDLRGIKQPMTREEAYQDSIFHHHLAMQSNSYMNSCFSVCAARCGMDDGKYSLIAGSCIVNPEGHIIAQAKSKEDEVIVAEIDLEECRAGKTKTFDFERHRRIEAYKPITQQVGVMEPDLI